MGRRGIAVAATLRDARLLLPFPDHSARQRQFFESDTQDVTQISSPFRAGDQVRVRRSRWHVVMVRAFGDCHVVTLSSLDRSSFGTRKQVIAPYDRIDLLQSS